MVGAAAGIVVLEALHAEAALEAQVALAPARRRSAQVDGVDRLEAEVMPVVDDLHVYYYLLHPGPCRVLDYARGDYSDGPNCGDNPMPLDARAEADFEALTDAIERSGVAVERIHRDGGAIYIPLQDYSWQYNWEYVHLSDVDTPPPTRWPGEEWTHIRGDWWFHRAHDD